MNWKLAAPVFAGALSIASLPGCAAEIVAPRAPPAERVEVVTVAPSANQVWIRGHWRWDGRDYDWVAGHWEVRHAEAVWVPGHWQDTGHGWAWREGHWATR